MYFLVTLTILLSPWEYPRLLSRLNHGTKKCQQTLLMFAGMFHEPLSLLAVEKKPLLTP